MPQTLSEQVREFMQVMGQKLPEYPGTPNKDVIKLRLELIHEEYQELLDACNAFASGDSILLSDGDIDMVGLADALADIDYVVEGMRLAFGIRGKPIADEVHRSNLAKVGSVKDARGKVTKPPGWSPPDVDGCLRMQGWQP